jgi:hypothetical protein
MGEITGEVLFGLWGLFCYLCGLGMCVLIKKTRTECYDRNHVGLRKIINKLGMGLQIFPDPELGQDVAFVAMVIENQHRLIDEYKQKEVFHG